MHFLRGRVSGISVIFRWTRLGCFVAKVRVTPLQDKDSARDDKSTTNMQRQGDNVLCELA